MSDEHVFQLPDDAKEFTPEDSRRKRLAKYPSRVESNGNVRVCTLTAEKYRKVCPGEVTWLRCILSESAGIAVLYQGEEGNGFAVRTEPGSSAFEFGFAGQLAELGIHIPKGWYAAVDSWVEPKVSRVDGPCLLLDLRNRVLAEVDEKDKKKGAAVGDQQPDQK